VLFRFVTLPVELDASRRAMISMQGSGTLSPEQLAGVRQVLTVTALTYAAAALISAPYFLYYLGLLRRR